ncbi:MAG: hypothetical protein HQL20_02950 [Candidatus Omnitrophica bacterium]|nr:hypothetical protein [Candidatus Omnitrophota bacterium]
MKKEYDFSTAQRGKFFNKNADMNLPVYLDRASSSFVVRLARQRKKDISSVVNDLIRGDIQLARVMQ